MEPEVFRAVVDALDRGEAAALAVVVSTSGSAPQRVGAKMLVFEDGRVVGTIGGGRDEGDAIARAREAIRLKRPELVRYDLDNTPADGAGPICGGAMEVYIEPVEAAPHLYLVGAGHVSAEIARTAAKVGFRVHVVDDREQFANAARFPDAEVVVGDIAAWLERQAFPPDAYFVVVTRGHQFDYEAVRRLVDREARYLGMIGSRTKVAHVFKMLREQGVPAECIAAIHAPIGLDIGAVTPAEIAVSIVAEMVAVRSGRISEPHVAAAAMRSCC